MKIQPKVSIITPVYNSEKFLSECIDSVLAQTYRNWEQIFIDDQSIDASVAIIESYQKKDERFILIKSEKNNGAGKSRNFGIKQAAGRIIAFLDSDDIWLPEKLEKHVAFMISQKAAFSHTSYGFIDEKSNIINKTYRVSNQPIGYKDLLKKIEISCLTAMYDTDYLGKMYMPDLRIKEDYALWLSILKKGFTSLPLDEELAYYRQRKGSSTNKKYTLILKHLRFLYFNEKLGIFGTLYYTFWWAYNGTVKYYIPKLSFTK